MSTRAAIIIKDSKFGTTSELIFYRPSDGYPAGVKKTLGEFIALVRADKIRDNVRQAAGWLIVMGAEEYADYGENLATIRANTKGTGMIFKVGAYEPAPNLPSDIEYLYEIDLTAKTLRGWHYHGQKGAEIDQRELDQPHEVTVTATVQS